MLTDPAPIDIVATYVTGAVKVPPTGLNVMLVDVTLLANVWLAGNAPGVIVPAAADATIIVAVVSITAPSESVAVHSKFKT